MIRSYLRDFKDQNNIAAQRAERQKMLVTAREGRISTLTAASSMNTGIGRNNPLENGFYTDWTSGWPSIPGAALKGMTRSWAEFWATTDEIEIASRCACDLGLSIEDCFSLIFGGAPDADHSGAAGGVIFLDGLILPNSDGRLPVGFEVMTPHYNAPGPQGDHPPSEPANQISYDIAEWSKPTPVPYLVVDAGTKLQTGLLRRDPDLGLLLDVAENWMVAAFATVGIGSKTRVGHGLFKRA